jgi:hypothetical protein
MSPALFRETTVIVRHRTRFRSKSRFDSFAVEGMHKLRGWLLSKHSTMFWVFFDYRIKISIPHFKSVTVGQKWMPKLDIFSAN